MKRFTSDAESAIVLARVVRDFNTKKSKSTDSLYSVMKLHGRGSHSQASKCMKSLKRNSIITSHGCKGNRMYYTNIKSPVILQEMLNN